ncbi:uncharacterized protein L3040_000219 [Drepanopeziza brunnea f. sp. 'multigermtubi']|uniref:uncharacterized protein n=1 Tax=Drepanopeziza brunnea f. sp. 'multigermtubi' TaxID=698441 RepID=UPI0023879910|nr:hypothetical protein L3040_000219 [Drepanopeziza brunnea f. sp. 'multigermtubi']
MADAALRLLTSSLHIIASAASSVASPSSTTDPHLPHLPPLPLSRRTSWGSVVSASSSTDTTDTTDTELRPWDYSRRREQDEVRRKRQEGSVLKDRLAERTWREFWG